MASFNYVPGTGLDSIRAAPAPTSSYPGATMPPARPAYSQPPAYAHSAAAAPMYAEPAPVYQQPAQYSTFEPNDKAKGVVSGLLPRGPRRRMNMLAVVMALVVPWAFFALVFWVVSFSIHYQSPGLMYAILAISFVAVASIGVAAWGSLKKKEEGDPNRVPTWVIFIFLTSALAWLVGFVAGSINFASNMQPFYDVLNLNMYPGVDPSTMRGQQLMDAGRILFVDQAHVDVTKSMGFKNLDLYCVAPVTLTNNGTYQQLANYDFWAVGTNCCSGSFVDFHCGEFNNPKAHGALRLMRDEQRAFYRLAVQQAEAAYSIKASHPIFLSWMQDPMAEVNAYQEEGYRMLLIGIFTYFAAQLFMVLCAVIAFSKLGAA